MSQSKHRVITVKKLPDQSAPSLDPEHLAMLVAEAVKQVMAGTGVQDVAPSRQVRLDAIRLKRQRLDEEEQRELSSLKEQREQRELSSLNLNG